MRYFHLTTPCGGDFWLPADDSGIELISRWASATGGYVDLQKLSQRQIDRIALALGDSAHYCMTIQ